MATSYGGGCGVPLLWGSMGCVYNGFRGDYGKGGPLLGKVALDVVVGFDFLDMYCVFGVGDELYNYFNEGLVWVVPLGCGAK